MRSPFSIGNGLALGARAWLCSVSAFAKLESFPFVSVGSALWLALGSALSLGSPVRSCFSFVSVGSALGARARLASFGSALVAPARLCSVALSFRSVLFVVVPVGSAVVARARLCSFALLSRFCCESNSLAVTPCLPYYPVTILCFSLFLTTIGKNKKQYT